MEAWLALAPAVFGVIGTLAGGWVAYQSGVFAARRAERREATKSLVVLLDSALQDTPDPGHRRAAHSAAASLASFGFGTDSVLLLLDVAAAWADLAPQLASGETDRNLVVVADDGAQMKGPDVGKHYIAGIVAALKWLNAPRHSRQALQGQTQTSLQIAKRVLESAKRGQPWTGYQPGP